MKNYNYWSLSIIVQSTIKKYLFILVTFVNCLFAQADEVTYNIDYHLKYFYDAQKAHEIKQIIDKSSNGKCSKNDKNELLCIMNEDEFKKIIDQDSIVGVSILNISPKDGEFGGLGITVGEKPQKLFKILKVYKGSPANGQLQNEDEILEIDGVQTKTLTIDELIQKLRGKPNTNVTLKILRDKTTLTKTLARDIVKISDEEMIVLTDDEHLQLSFENGFNEKFSDKLAKHIFQKPYKKLTLDMRRSYGGNFYEILSSLGLFLPDNKELFYTMQNGYKEIQIIPKQKMSIKYDEDKYTKTITTTPMFDKEVEIIIDDTTYSGSLLFAYAMHKYYSKCKIIGEKSGKFDYLYAINELPVSAQTKEANIAYLFKFAIGEFYTLDGDVLSGKTFFDVVKYK